MCQIESDRIGARSGSHYRKTIFAQLSLTLRNTNAVKLRRDIDAEFYAQNEFASANLHDLVLRSSSENSLSTSNHASKCYHNFMSVVLRQNYVYIIFHWSIL